MKEMEELVKLVTKCKGGGVSKQLDLLRKIMDKIIEYQKSRI